MLNSTQSQEGGSAVSRKAAAEQFNVSQDGVRRAKALKIADPEAFSEVKAGTTTLREAEKRAAKPRRPEPSPDAVVDGQVVKPARPPRQDPTLVDRIYRTVQSYPGYEEQRALAEEIQTANLDLPEDAIRKLRDHLSKANRGRLALVEGLKTLQTTRSA